MFRICGLTGFVVAVLASTAFGQVPLTWKWREGDSFWVQQNLVKKVRTHAVSTKPDAKPIDFTHDVKRSIVCKVLVVGVKPDGNVTLDLTFEQVEWSGNGPIKDDPLTPLEGQSVQVVLDRKCKLVQSSGVDVLVSRATIGRPAEVRLALTEMVKDNLKSWIERIYVPLSPTPVQAGNAWEDDVEGDELPQGKWKCHTTYSYGGSQEHNGKTLHSIKTKTTSSLTPSTKPQSGTVRFDKTTITKDESVGHVWFNNDTGRPVQVTNTTCLEYTCEMTEQDHKVKGGNDLLSSTMLTFLDRSPFADKLLPRQPFDPAERLKTVPGNWPRQLTTSLNQKLNLIPPGSFVMGSPRTEAGRYGNEQEHVVELTRSIYMGVTEVTVGQFKQFVTETGYATEAEQHYLGAHGFDATTKEMVTGARFTWKNTGWEQTDDSPVVNVSWNDAVKFCEWLSAKDKRKYRLPTEAEWEYACRAGTTTRFPCGEDVRALVTIANCADEASVKATFPTFEMIPGNDGFLFTAPVGRLKANGWGLHDMAGNVLEWCSDWLGEMNVKDNKDPKGPESGIAKVMRGGSWPDFASDQRVARRSGFPPNCRYCTTGFRIVLEP